MTPGYFAANAFPVRAFPDLMWLAFGTLDEGFISAITFGLEKPAITFGLEKPAITFGLEKPAITFS